MKRISNPLLGVLLALIVAVMFAFAYANVPLFRLVCERFGILGEGKAGTKGEISPGPSSATGPILDREIRVKFVGVSGTGLPVRFGPSEPSVTVHPGQSVRLTYTFTNMSDDSVFFRAVHSIAPPAAAKEFQLLQCFCFEDQSLGPRETRDLPVYFALSPRTPENVNEVLLSYSLFPRDPERGAGVSARDVN